jgi:hypothetical protein
MLTAHAFDLAAVDPGCVTMPLEDKTKQSVCALAVLLVIVQHKVLDMYCLKRSSSDHYLLFPSTSVCIIYFLAESRWGHLSLAVCTTS